MTTQVLSPSRPAASVLAGTAQVVSRVRLSFIDNLRILLTSLVVLHHLAIAYGASGDFNYVEKGSVSVVSTALLSLFVAINQAFFMGLFFLISSYMTPGSYERKGALQYLADRIKRLGIPLLVYAFVIQPLIAYMLSPLYGFHGSFWEFLSVRAGREFGVGPLWFVETLLLFALAYVLFRQITRSTSIRFGPRAKLGAPNNLSIALFALALGLVTFVVRFGFPVGWWLEPLHLQLGDFPQYIALLIVGIIAYRHDWFSQWSDAQGRFWGRVALILIPVAVAIYAAGGALKGDLSPFFGGPSWQALVYAVWEQFMCVAMSISLLIWFRGRQNHQGTLARSLSNATYAVYVLHPPAIVMLMLALRPIQLEGGLKFLLVAPVAVALCFALGLGTKKLPVLRDIL